MSTNDFSIKLLDSSYGERERKEDELQRCWMDLVHHLLCGQHPMPVSSAIETANLVIDGFLRYFYTERGESIQ